MVKPLAWPPPSGAFSISGRGIPPRGRSPGTPGGRGAVLVEQLVHRLADLEMAAAQQAGLLELRQHAVHGGQADVRLLVKPAAPGRRLRPSWRCSAFWKISRIFRRGSVAFRPVLLSSSMLSMLDFARMGSARRAGRRYNDRPLVMSHACPSSSTPMSARPPASCPDVLAAAQRLQQLRQAANLPTP